MQTRALVLVFALALAAPALAAEAPGIPGSKVKVSGFPTADDLQEAIDEGLLGAGDEAAAHAACRRGVKGWGYDAATDTYGAVCGIYAWSAESGGTASGVPSYQTATTSGGNAFWLTCTAAGVGTGSDGTSYSLATFLQPGGSASGKNATGSGSTTTLLDSGITVANRYRDHILELLSGPGSSAKRRITGNTAGGTITVDVAFGASTTSSTVYRIYDDTASACWGAGEDVRVNAMADLALAQDHLRPGGKLYLSQRTAGRPTAYLHRQCGRKGNASTTNAPNNCPVLRAPSDEHYQRAVQAVGQVDWIFEGGVDTDLGENGRSGTWLADDAGNAPGGTFTGLDGNDGATPVKLWRTGVGPTFGNLSSGVRICDANAAGACLPASSSADRIVGAAWGHAPTILNSGNITSPSGAWCVSNDQTGDGGLCRADRRKRCTVDADCDFSGGGGANEGPCDSVAEAIEYDVEVAKRELYAWVAIARTKFPETATGLGEGTESGWGRIVDAPRSSSGCSGSGQTITFDQWPVHAAQVFPVTATLQIADRATVDAHYHGMRGFTWTPNNYYGRDLDGDGVSDPGDCLSAGDYDEADDEPECDNDGFSLLGGRHYAIRDGVIGNCSAHPAGGGFSCFDGDTSSFAHAAEHILIKRPRRGYLGDLSDVRLSDLVVEDCPSGSLQHGINTAFVSVAEVGRFTFKSCIAPNLISFGSGHQVKVHDFDFIGTTAAAGAITIQNADGLVIDRGRFDSHRGPGIVVLPSSRLGPISLTNLQSSGACDPAGGSNAYPYAFVQFHRGFGTGSGVQQEIAGITAQNIVYNTVRSNAVLFWFDRSPESATAGINLYRQRWTLLDSSLNHLAGATGGKAVVVDVTNGGGAESGDCTAGSAPSAFVCDAQDDEGIYAQRFLPVIRNLRVDGVPIADQPWPQTNAALAGDCDDPGVRGRVALISDDATAGGCADGGDGVLNGGGTAVSVCKCGSAWGAF